MTRTLDELLVAGEKPSALERLKHSSQTAFKRMQLPQEQILDVVTQLAIMFETGLNLSQALEVLEKQSGTAHLREFVASIRRGVENGKPLSTSMAQQAWAFSPVALALVRAGEMTGDLATMLNKVAAFMERDIGTRKKVRSAMAYPAFMAFMACGVVTFLLVNVFPKFAELFSDKPDELPGPTRFFMALSEFMQAHIAWMLPVGLFGVACGVLAIRSPEGKRIFDPLFLKLPAFGPLIKAVSISRSFHVLGVMMNAGLNVLEALQLSSDVSGNYEYEAFWKRTKSKVENGAEISDSLMDNPLIPPAEAAMISLGERSGTLPTVLEKLTKHHERKVEGAIKAFVGVIEPAMTIAMGAVVALIVASLIMPMFAISKVMR